MHLLLFEILPSQNDPSQTRLNIVSKLSGTFQSCQEKASNSEKKPCLTLSKINPLLLSVSPSKRLVSTYTLLRVNDASSDKVQRPTLGDYPLLGVPGWPQAVWLGSPRVTHLARAPPGSLCLGWGDQRGAGSQMFTWG